MTGYYVLVTLEKSSFSLFTWSLTPPPLPQPWYHWPSVHPYQKKIKLVNIIIWVMGQRIDRDVLILWTHLSLLTLRPIGRCYVGLLVPLRIFSWLLSATVSNEDRATALNVRSDFQASLLDIRLLNQFVLLCGHRSQCWQTMLLLYCYIIFPPIAWFADSIMSFHLSIKEIDGI